VSVDKDKALVMARINNKSLDVTHVMKVSSHHRKKVVWFVLSYIMGVGCEKESQSMFTLQRAYQRYGQYGELR
jgi:hypothetical protein